MVNEKLTSVRKDKQAKFEKVWNPWIAYLQALSCWTTVFLFFFFLPTFFFYGFCYDLMNLCKVAEGDDEASLTLILPHE